MRVNEREKKRALGTNQKERKKMACNGVDCRGGSFFFFICTLKQEKEQWRK